jgi:hypothetical protein
MKRPSRAPKKPILVTTPIRTPGIQGQVYIRSSCARHLYNATHVLEYANVMGTQLGFEFLAELLEDEQKYRVDSVGNSVQGDTVLEEGRTWKHVGWSQTHNTKPMYGEAEIVSSIPIVVGACKLTYRIYFREPNTAFCTNSLVVPLT